MDPRKWAPLIRQLASKYGVDPQAALAVASVEGLSGAVGDGGHAFGPFQMNDAGGVLTGRFGSSAARRAYAESPAGIEEAIRSMSKVAGGLKGKAAVAAIVKRYERPADPEGEISRALGHYGGKAPSGSNTEISAQLPQGQDLARQMILSQLLGATQQFASGGQASALDPGATLRMLQVVKQMGAVPGPSGAATQEAANPSPGPLPKGISFSGNTKGVDRGFLSQVANAAKAVGGSQVVITSGYRDPEHNASVGGVTRSNHLSGHALDGYVVVNGRRIPLGTAMRAIANKYGLRSGDVPGFFNGKPDPVHVDDGFNTRR